MHICRPVWVASSLRQIGKMLKIPVIKFLLHSASYLWFLIFLLVESLVMEHYHETFKGRNQSVWETSLHMIWVAGKWEKSVWRGDEGGCRQETNPNAQRSWICQSLSLCLSLKFTPHFSEGFYTPAPGSYNTLETSTL